MFRCLKVLLLAATIAGMRSTGKWQTGTTLLIAGMLHVVAYGEGLPKISDLQDIRNLSRKDASLGLPVRMRAVVTYDNPEKYGPLVVSDATAGIYVMLGATGNTYGETELLEGAEHIPDGTELEIEGLTGSGGYAPVIMAHRIRITGEAPVPEALRLTAPELQTGRFDCQRVEVRGVVSRAERNPGSAQIDFDLETELGGVIFHFNENPGFHPEELVDAEVTVRGVCLMYFNRRNEQVGAHIHVGGMGNVTVHRSPPPDPFDVPSIEFDRLRPFSADPRNLHRRKISGTVTYIRPKEFLMLQNRERSVRVNLREDFHAKVGRRAEAAGFVETREFYAELGNAIVREVGNGERITPVQVGTLEVMGAPDVPAYRMMADFDGRLVAMNGRLIAVTERPGNGWLLLAESDGTIVECHLAGRGSPRLPQGVRAGSLVEMTGVCMVSYTEKVPARAFARPRSFGIYLRTAADIRVIDAAPWWTPKRLRIVIAVLVGGSLLSGLWVWTLRRRVGQRARELAEEIEARQNAEVEFEATLRERKRLGADLHDTLEQTLSGLSRQLEAAEELQKDDPKRSASHLGLARQLLDRSQEDVRRSVWNLHSSSLEDLSLPDALLELVEYRSVDVDMELRVVIEGRERALPDFISGNLVLLAQEGITNAFKHSGAETIILRLSFADEAVDLSIEDDGSGFIPNDAPGPQEGHFGLQSMRERVKRMGGRLVVKSAPGKGTVLSASLRA